MLYLQEVEIHMRNNACMKGAPAGHGEVFKNPIVYTIQSRAAYLDQSLDTSRLRIDRKRYHIEPAGATFDFRTCS